jgi:muconate cycloisomerase
MKIQSATIFITKIPFRKTFSHSTKVRKTSESVIVKLKTDTGIVGYGEGAPRFYVTGEKMRASVKYMEKVLWPKISSVEYLDIKFNGDPTKALAQIKNSLPNHKTKGVIAWNSAIAAMELAIIDCLLKQQKKSLSDLLMPKRQSITYSGVIGLGSIKDSEILAKKYKTLGIKQVKIKIGNNDDWGRIEKIRNILGSACSIRLDVNGAFTVKKAIKTLAVLERYNISCVEQPVKRGNYHSIKKVKDNVSMSVMADESLVTITDAKNLIRHKACDYFNLRISKLGGISRTLEIAKMAKLAGLRLQLGCLAGETAILSAAGRFLAAYLDNVYFIEGSFGNLLLAEDVSKKEIHFGYGGKAPLLKGYGLGIEVDDKILAKYSSDIVVLDKQ